jgi:hypothetical protein
VLPGVMSRKASIQRNLHGNYDRFWRSEDPQLAVQVRGGTQVERCALIRPEVRKAEQPCGRSTVR